MKVYFKYLIILIIGLTAGIYIISAFNSSKNDVVINLLKKRQDSLTLVLKENNKKLLIQDIKISNFENKINKVDSQYVIYESKINKLTKYANQKIKAVDTFSNDSLYKSLTNRYSK